MRAAPGYGREGYFERLGAIPTGDDYELRCDAAASLSHMSVSDELKMPICQAQVLPDLLSLVQLGDNALTMHVARTIAELADVSENEATLFKAGVLDVLVRLIAPLCMIMRRV